MIKNKYFYFILIFAIITILIIGFTMKYDFKYFKYWIWSIGSLVFFTWNKDVITGSKWFEKAKQKPAKWNTPLSTRTNKDYEEYVNLNYSNTLEEEKEGYLGLTKLIVSPKKQAQLINFFENLKDYSQDNDYGTTLNYVIEFLYKEEISFIMSFDWKSDIFNFESQLIIYLKENYNSTIEMPKAENYDFTASISYDNVFEDFDRPLRKNGLQLGFIDTQSDEYIVIIHKVVDKEIVGNLVNKIGYKYFEK